MLVWNRGLSVRLEGALCHEKVRFVPIVVIARFPIVLELPLWFFLSMRLFPTINLFDVEPLLCPNGCKTFVGGNFLERGVTVALLVWEEGLCSCRSVDFLCVLCFLAWNFGLGLSFKDGIGDRESIDAASFSSS